MTHTTLPPMPARDSLTGDIHRPQFHFLPPANWMNDPNGIIQENGRLHLFYQYNPEGAWHGNIHWGHAVTTDLVHWSDLPIALAPGPDGPDAEGCWSGCAVDDQGIPTLVYTSASPQTVSLATSTDELVTWTKHAGNPVIAGPPFELAKRAEGNFRDPFVWRQDGSWYLIIGSKIMDVGGTILLYRSQDLVHWDYLHPLLIGDVHGAEPFWTGTMWECPLFLDFGARQALVTSVQATRVDHLYPAYATGSFQDERFTLEVQDILAHGGYFYAPHTGRLEDGRHVMWGWLREARSPQVSQWAGWAGTMSLPLIVSLEPDGHLALAPAAELQALRDEHRHFEHVAAASGAGRLLEGVQGNCLEIIADFDAGPDAEFGLAIACSPDGREQTRIVYRGDQGQLILEREQSSLSVEVERDARTAPLALGPGEPLRLHVFLDRSVVEVFANDGRAYLVGRIYPLRPDSLGVGAFVRRGAVAVSSLDVWTLQSIWRTR